MRLIDLSAMLVHSHNPRIIHINLKNGRASVRCEAQRTKAETNKKAIRLVDTCAERGPDRNIAMTCRWLERKHSMPRICCVLKIQFAHDTIYIGLIVFTLLLLFKATSHYYSLSFVVFVERTIHCIQSLPDSNAVQTEQDDSTRALSPSSINEKQTDSHFANDT